MNDTHHKLTLPPQLAEQGFYYHYKHDPEGPVNNFAYLILGTGHHTEDDARPEDKFQQLYLPLYEDALVYQMGKLYDLRPLGMAVGTVEVEGKTVLRFQKIDDETVIEQLKEIGRNMYGAWPW